MTLIFAITNDAGVILRPASREEILGHKNIPANVRALVEQLPQNYPFCWFKEEDTFASIPIDPADLVLFVELINAYPEWVKPLKGSGMPDEAISRLNRNRVKAWCLLHAATNQRKRDIATLHKVDTSHN